MKCGRVVWNCNTCLCGNDKESNVKLSKVEDMKKKAEELDKKKKKLLKEVDNCMKAVK